MKFYSKFILLGCIFILINCGRSDYSISPVEIDELYSIIPENLLNSKSICFTNANNEETCLEVTTEERIVTKLTSEKNEEYKAKQLHIYMGGMLNNRIFQLSILGSTTLHDNNDIISGLTYNSMSHMNPSGISTSINVVFKNSELFRDRFTESVILNGEEYSQVGLRIKDELSSYNQLYITKEHGILGFSDLNNEIWVFSGLE